MRKLHLVGLTTDRDGLIFTARKGSKSGGFIVPLDDTVLAAVAEAQAERNGAAKEPEIEAVPRRPRHQSALTPREMQARLRAGRSIEEVAAEAGVDNDWVARFAVPILAEQAQVVELARGLVYAKPRLGESSQPLGPSVMQNLADRGVFIPDDVADAGWSAFQLHDSVWLVRFRYRSRGREQEARWELDVPEARLLARNRHASDLGYVDERRRRRAAEEDPAEAEPEPPRRGAREKAATPPAKTAARPPAKPAKSAARTKSGRAAVPAKPARPATPAKTAKAAVPAKTARPATPAKTARAATPAKTAKSAARAKTARPAVPAKAAKSAKTPAKRGAAATAAATKRVTPAKAVAARRPVAKAGRGGRAAAVPAPAPAVAKTSPRRPAKAAPAPDPAPPGRAGGVRSAVAQVSTARVTASLATAERAPWAEAVRSRGGARLASANGDDRPGARRLPPPVPSSLSRPGAPRADEDDRLVRAFQPRPLPPAGDRQAQVQPPVAERVRKVTVSTSPPRSEVPSPPVAPPEPLSVERPKRRRLRSR